MKRISFGIVMTISFWFSDMSYSLKRLRNTTRQEWIMLLKYSPLVMLAVLKPSLFWSIKMCRNWSTPGYLNAKSKDLKWNWTVHYIRTVEEPNWIYLYQEFQNILFETNGNYFTDKENAEIRSIKSRCTMLSASSSDKINTHFRNQALAHIAILKIFAMISLCLVVLALIGKFVLVNNALISAVNAHILEFMTWRSLAFFVAGILIGSSFGVFSVIKELVKIDNIIVSELLEIEDRCEAEIDFFKRLNIKKEADSMKDLFGEKMSIKKIVAL